MILLPAVDIRHGRAVRLRQGDFDHETVYNDDPLEAALAWVEAGARELHVVDLDGAREGVPASLGHLQRIAGEVPVPIQYGGGLRSLDAIGQALDAGATRVVVGTRALARDGFLEEAVGRHGGRVAAAVDARRGEVAVAGWTERSGEGADAVAERLARLGIGRLVYTDVDRDGMLRGPNLGMVSRVAAAGASARLTYSGGVGSLDHLRSLRALGLATLDAVICGKALYERRFTVAEGQGALDDGATTGRPEA